VRFIKERREKLVDIYQDSVTNQEGLLDKIKIAVTPELKIDLKFNRGQFFLWSQQQKVNDLGDTNIHWS